MRVLTSKKGFGRLLEEFIKCFAAASTKKTALNPNHDPKVSSGLLEQFLWGLSGHL